jgi:aldose 1-epimerase
MARNIGDKVSPLAFGHHCYFDGAEARLRFKAKRYYANGPDMLPLDAVAVAAATDFTFDRRVADGDFDNCFGGWDGKARIGWAGKGYALSIESDMPQAVLFTPKGEDFFCFEPVPHINNALNRTHGDMPGIAPGCSYKSHIRFTAISA